MHTYLIDVWCIYSISMCTNVIHIHACIHTYTHACMCVNSVMTNASSLQAPDTKFCGNTCMC